MMAIRVSALKPTFVKPKSAVCRKTEIKKKPRRQFHMIKSNKEVTLKTR